MSEDTNELLAQLRLVPERHTRGKLDDALRIAQKMADIAVVLAEALPTGDKLAGSLRKLLDTRTALLEVLAERGGGPATPGS